MSGIIDIEFFVIKVRQLMGEFFIGNIGVKIFVDIFYFDVRCIEDEDRDVERYLGI